ncbi:MAG TPA: acyltransferase family protein [Acidimicrobiales bacterium]|nr:acyltransferase family protein [Acidimicrobiales bacterium]
MARVVDDDRENAPGPARPGDEGSGPGGRATAGVPDHTAPDDPEPPRAELTYRPALDGLRAVAVLAVMVHHAAVRVPWIEGAFVPGGFLGVDVFFVVSGFLITSLLLVELRRDGRVDLRAFWTRRARRLLPAVGVSIVATALIVGLADLRLDAISARGDALASLAYVANWRFVLTDQSYFDSFGLPSPYRHLWSLSVEEQWYLLFPPLIALLGGIVLRRPRAFLVGLAVAAGASAVWMAVLHEPGDDPSRAYYGTDTRAHTLLVGAALAAVMVLFPGATRRARRHLPALSVAGAAALLLAFRTVEGKDAGLYGGGFLLVALASAATVAGVALPGARGPVHWLLARRVPVAIGRISYGLYLWHWPIDVWLTPDRVGRGGALLIVLRFAAAFAAAGLSYVVLERPIRRHGLAGVRARLARVGLRSVRPVALTLVAGAAAAGLVTVATLGGGPGVMPASLAAFNTTSTRPRPVTTTSVAPDHPLPAVSRRRDLRVVLGGDSVAWSIGYGLGVRHAVPDDVLIGIGADWSCTVTPGVAVADGVEEHSNCGNWRRTWQSMAQRMDADVVVAIWGAWEVYDHQRGDTLLRAGTPEAAAAYSDALRDGIDATIAAQPDVRFAFVTVPCMNEREAALGAASTPRNNPALLAWVNELTVAVAAGYGDRAKVIDLGPLLCPDGEVLQKIDGVTVRDDGVHFSAKFASVVWDYVDDRIRPWLAAPGVSGPG